MTIGANFGLPTVFLSALILLPQGPTSAEESREFDVPADKEEDILGGTLVSGLVLTCKFAFSGKNTGTTRIPWASLVFFEEPPEDDNWDNVRQVGLYTYRRQGSEFFRGPNRWHYVLYFGGKNIRDSSEEIATANGRTPVHAMSLALVNERHVQALVGEKLEEPWVVDFSPFEFKYWKVVVSGLRGWAFCGTNNSTEPKTSQ